MLVSIEIQDVVEYGIRYGKESKGGSEGIDKVSVLWKKN